MWDVIKKLLPVCGPGEIIMFNATGYSMEDFTWDPATAVLDGGKAKYAHSVPYTGRVDRRCCGSMRLLLKARVRRDMVGAHFEIRLQCERCGELTGWCRLPENMVFEWENPGAIAEHLKIMAVTQPPLPDEEPGEIDIKLPWKPGKLEQLRDLMAKRRAAVVKTLEPVGDVLVQDVQSCVCDCKADLVAGDRGFYLMCRRCGREAAAEFTIQDAVLNWRYGRLISTGSVVTG